MSFDLFIYLYLYLYLYLDLYLFIYIYIYILFCFIWKFQKIQVTFLKICEKLIPSSSKSGGSPSNSPDVNAIR